MDVRNLQKHYPLLLEYLHDNGYSRCHIQWMKRCIKLALNKGSSPEINSYEQLYWHEVQQLCEEIRLRGLVSTTKSVSWFSGTV